MPGFFTNMLNSGMQNAHNALNNRLAGTPYAAHYNNFAGAMGNMANSMQDCVNQPGIRDNFNNAVGAFHGAINTGMTQYNTQPSMNESPMNMNMNAPPYRYGGKSKHKKSRRGGAPKCGAMQGGARKRRRTRRRH